MIEEDPIKDAEKRGYAKGYQAGRRRLQREGDQYEQARRKEEFRRQAFLAAFQATAIKGGWTIGDKPVSRGTDYCKLAWSIADIAVKGTWF